MKSIGKWSLVLALLSVLYATPTLWVRSAAAAGTPTATATATASATLAAATRTATATATNTSAPRTATATATATSTNPPVATNSPTATKTNTPVPTNAPTVTRTATATATVQNTPTNTPTITPTPQNSPTATPTTFTFSWWYPTSPWPSNPPGPDPWNQNPYNLKNSYIWPTFNTPVPQGPAATGNPTPAGPAATGGATPSVPAAPGADTLATPSTAPAQSGSPWFFPNPFASGAPTLVALAPDGSQPQPANNPQAVDSTDPGAGTQPDGPAYYARRLGTVSILFAGLLLLGSGALGMAATLFFIRSRLRH